MALHDLRGRPNWEKEVDMATVESAIEIRPFHVEIPEEALEDLRAASRRHAGHEGAR
jgi:hypothetical protein